MRKCTPQTGKAGTTADSNHYEIHMYQDQLKVDTMNKKYNLHGAAKTETNIPHEFDPWNINFWSQIQNPGPQKIEVP